MDKQVIKMKLFECFEDAGIFIDEDCPEGIQLNNFIEDSIQFITLIVEIESAFDIEVPDEFLVIANFNTVDSVCDMLTELINN